LTNFEAAKTLIWEDEINLQMAVHSAFVEQNLEEKQTNFS
jgi:hypothetical protein